MIGRALLPFVLLALPASAQGAGPPATAEQCRALFDAVPLLQGPPATVSAEGADGCRFTGVSFGVGSRFSYAVGSLVEHGIPFGPPAVPDHPVAVRVEARDMVFALHSGQPKIDWLNRQQQSPIDVVAEFAFEPVPGVLRITELSVEGRTIGRTVLSGEVDGLSAAGRTDEMGVRSLALHLDSRRFVAAYLLSLAMPFLPEQDPDGAVQRLKAQAAAQLRAVLPAGGVPGEATEAILRLLADLPHPTQVFDLAVTAPEAVTQPMLEAAGADPAALLRLLRRLVVTASYAGEAR